MSEKLRGSTKEVILGQDEAAKLFSDRTKVHLPPIPGGILGADLGRRKAQNDQLGVAGSGLITIRQLDEYEIAAWVEWLKGTLVLRSAPGVLIG